MAETLTELVARISADATELEKGLTDAEKQTEASSKKMSDSLKKVGLAMVASGAAITAALGLMGKAAIDEDINIKRLDVSLRGVGTSYDNVKDSLERVISATQRKTGIADTEQRDTLARLLLVTKDYNKALSLLPLTLDVAAAGQMDTASAATYLAKAYEELEGGAEKIGIRLGTTTVYFKDLNEVQKLVGGTAEATANPFRVLAATISDLSETIGRNLIPITKIVIERIVSVIEKIQNWAVENPRLTEQLTLLSLAVGAVATAVGGLILILPKLKAGYIALDVVIKSATISVWGFYAALFAIPLAAAGVAIALSELTGNTAEMNKRGQTLWYQNIGNWIMKQLGLTTAIESTSGMASNLSKELMNLGLEGKELSRTFEILSKAGYLSIGTATIEQVKEYVSQLERLNKGVKEVTGTSGEFNIATEGSKIPLASAIQKIGEVTYRTQLYTEAEIALAEAAGAKTERIEQQSGALDKDASASQKVAREVENLRKEFDYQTSSAGRLGISMRDVTFALFNQGITLEELTQKFVSLGDDASNVNKVMEAFGLTAQAVKGILDGQKKSVDDLVTSYKLIQPPSPDFLRSPTRYPEAEERLKYFKNFLSNLGGMPEGAWVEGDFGLVGTVGSVKEALKSQIGIWERIANPPSFASGGVVPGTIGEPQLAMVHGGETIIPANEGVGSITIQFTQPVFFDREDDMNRFVDKISKTLDRKYRLRFGGAYSG